MHCLPYWGKKAFSSQTLISLANWHPGSKCAPLVCISIHCSWRCELSKEQLSWWLEEISECLQLLPELPFAGEWEGSYKPKSLDYLCTPEHVHPSERASKAETATWAGTRKQFSLDGWMAVPIGNFNIYCSSYLSRGLWCSWVKFTSVAFRCYFGFTLVLQRDGSGSWFCQWQKKRLDLRCSWLQNCH